MINTLCILVLHATLALGIQNGVGDRLVVLNKGEASASIIDVATGERVARLTTGVGPHEVVVSADRRRAVVTNYGDQQTVGTTLTVLDLGALEVEQTLDLGDWERPHGIAFLPDGRLVVTAETDSAVAVVDLDAGAVAFEAPTAGTLSHMLAVSPDGRYTYTANMISGTVSKVDLAERRVVASAETGPATEAVAVRPGGGEVWAASQEDGRVVVLDAGTFEEIGSLPVAGRPIRIAFTPDGKRALVTTVIGSELVVVDADARERLGTVPLPNDPEHANAAAASVPGGASALPIGIAVDPDGGTAFVALMGRDQVAVVDLDRLAVVRWLDTGSMPDGIAFVSSAE